MGAPGFHPVWWRLRLVVAGGDDACWSRRSKGKIFRVSSWVASRTTGQAAPASCTWSPAAAQTHQRSPDLRPGKNPTRGAGCRGRCRGPSRRRGRARRQCSRWCGRHGPPGRCCRSRLGRAGDGLGDAGFQREAREHSYCFFAFDWHEASISSFSGEGAKLGEKNLDELAQGAQWFSLGLRREQTLRIRPWHDYGWIGHRRRGDCAPHLADQRTWMRAVSPLRSQRG